MQTQNSQFDSAFNSLQLQEHSLLLYRKKGPKIGMCEGVWTLEENLKFVIFTDFYQNIFISKEKRKYYQIFKHLSQYLGSRSTTQCRSRFQKIIKTFHTLHKFKIHYINQVGSQSYAEKMTKFTVAHQNIELEPPFKLTCSNKKTVDAGVQTESFLLYDFTISSIEAVKLQLQKD